MKATLAKSEGFERTLEIIIESDKVKQSYNKALGKHARDIAVPGFRKGKAPRHLAEKALRPEFLRQNVLEDVGLSAYREALQEQGIEPISQPRVEFVQFEKDKEMIFRATFDVRPEIEAPEYQGLTVKAPQTEVQEDDIDAVLKSEQQKRTTVASLEEDRPLQAGDLANVNFESWEGGQPVEAGKAENLLVELNDDFVMPGFANHLVGMKKDESRRFTQDFASDYRNPTLAGKTIEFEFKLLDLKKRIVPELNDDFARQVSRYATLEEMRGEVRKQLEVELHTALANQAIDQILPTLHVHLPNSMLVDTGRNILGEWQKQLQSMGSDLQTFMRHQKWTADRLNSELLPRAHRVALAELVVEAVARKEALSVSDDEVSNEVERYARMSNQDTQMVRDSLENEKSLEQLRDNILRRKVLEHIFQGLKLEKIEPAAETAPAEAVPAADATPAEEPAPQPAEATATSD